MKVFLIFCLTMLLAQLSYESLQWFRPADYGLAAERWYGMVSGVAIWVLARWADL